MPANLTPQYFEAEKRFKEARNNQEKLRALKSMLSTIPKHKGTEKLQADIKRKIARVREETEREKRSGRRGFSYHVEKGGAGQVLLLGPPNAGKSSLVAAVTNAHPEVAEYPFTTQLPMPAMMPYENVQIQLVDAPPVAADVGGPWVSAIARSADLLALVIPLDDDALEAIEGIRAQLRHVHVLIGREADRDEEDVEEYVRLVRAVILANKLDLTNALDSLEVIRELYGPELPILAISATRGDNLEAMRRFLFDALRVMRVYTRAPGKKADYNQPVVLPRGSTVLDLAADIHKDFARNLRSARVWGSAKYDGLNVARDHVLQDGDTVELHI